MGCPVRPAGDELVATRERLARLEVATEHAADEVLSIHDTIREIAQAQAEFHSRFFVEIRGLRTDLREDLARADARVTAHRREAEETARVTALHAVQIREITDTRARTETRIRSAWMSAIGAVGAAVLAVFGWLLTRLPDRWLPW